MIIADMPASHYEMIISERLNFQNLDSLDHLEGSTPEVTRIYFIRQGESEFNIVDKSGVQFTSGIGKEIPLTERGQEQSDEIASKLALKIEGATVYSSDSLRAQQTAKSLVETGNMALGERLEGFCEVGMGKWEGQPKDELYKSEYQKWKDLPANEKFNKPKVPTAETFQETGDRALNELQKLVDKEQGKTIFIVSHYHTMNILAMHWMKPQLSAAPGSELPMLPFDNCDLFMIEIPHGQSIEKAQVKMLIKGLE